MDGKNKIIGIQILRVVACLMVFLVHFSQIMKLESIFGISYSYGAYGVYLFFVISGFLAWRKENDEKNNKIDFKKYYIKKFLRLAPLFYIVIGINIIFHTFIYKDVPIDSYGLGWWRYFLFIFQVIPTDNEFWINITATWTIGVFAIFYLLAPLMKKCIDNYKLSLIITGILYVLSKYYYLFINNGYFNFLKYLYPFFFGVTAYLALCENKEKSLIIICTIISFFTKNNILLFVCLFTILVLVMQDFKIDNKYVLKIVEILDKYSYGIYLFHALIIDTLYHYNLNKYVNALIIIIGTVMISGFLTKYVADPIYKLGKKLMKEGFKNGQKI